MDRKQLQETYGIIGESPAFQQALDKVLQVAPTDITVLIHGETGVGKDITARALHNLSLRKSGNLVLVNCGAIPEGIIESELFGHEKGAYTGAHESRMGYFEQADGGTIFLDEIVDTPKSVQVKLLRVLESGEFFRVGSSNLRTVDVRVIAATNKDLWKSVNNGDFREDLYYRLNTVTINIPPLRERGEDILLIFRSFVKEFAQKYDSVFRGMSDEARKLLLSYRWPGNIRELRNVAEQLVVLEKSQFIDEEVLKKYLKGRQSLGSPDNLPMVFGKEHDQGSSFRSSQNKEMQLIYQALLEMRNDMSDLKRMLGSLLYATLRGENIPRSLPAKIQSAIKDYHFPEKESNSDEKSDLMVGVSPYNEEDVDFDDSDNYNENETTGTGNRNVPETLEQELTDDQRRVMELFGNEDLPSLEDVEKFLIRQALEKYNGNRRKASRILGMSERTLYRKIDQYELM